jgi:oligopeptide/dipeptide ABC transporter ATP-binding protein
MSSYLLNIQDLKTFFFTTKGVVKAVDGISLKIREGESVGLVGESGCGKSTIGLSIMRLTPYPGRIVSGEIKFRDENLLEKSDKEIREIRGAKISMSFQDPTTYLNPVISIGKQIAECIEMHQNIGKKEALKKVIEILELVGISDPLERVKDYPFQLSGGMKQRVMIALAISCRPELLIADEPTTALDVIVQSQILDLLRDLKNELKMSLLLISHDIGIVAELCEQVAVMYAGKIVEFGDAQTIFPSSSTRHAIHPYTVGLLSSVPKLDKKTKTLRSIKGVVPDMINPPPGCSFNARCNHATDTCMKTTPEFTEIEPGHFVACYQANSLLEEKGFN